MEKREYKIKLETEILGTVAMDPEIFKRFIESKKPKEKNDENEAETVEKMELKGWTGFHKDENGLFIYEYMIKGFLKHAGNVQKDILKIKALRAKIDDFVFVEPRRISLGQDKPDGVLERPIRVMIPLGPRVSLVRSDYVEAGKVITFRLKLLPHKEITWKVLDDLLKHGELMGLGQFRNGGYGRFKVIESRDVG